MGSRHEYMVSVGCLRGDTPADIRTLAIDTAVDDVPDPGALYEVIPGYQVTRWNDDLDVLRVEDVKGEGRLAADSVWVRVSVDASAARWQASPGKAARRG